MELSLTPCIAECFSCAALASTYRSTASASALPGNRRRNFIRESRVSTNNSRESAIGVADCANPPIASAHRRSNVIFADIIVSITIFPTLSIAANKLCRSTSHFYLLPISCRTPASCRLPFGNVQFSHYATPPSRPFIAAAKRAPLSPMAPTNSFRNTTRMGFINEKTCAAATSIFPHRTSTATTDYSGCIQGKP